MGDEILADCEDVDRTTEAADAERESRVLRI
jgi:hypothetical protein